MEEEQNLVDEGTSETEDFPLSASEEVDVPLDTDCPINIDYNNRVITGKFNYEDFEKENCDSNFVDNFSHLKHRRKSENELYTSTEDLDVSDEEKPCCSTEPLEYGSLIGACSKKNMDSLSTLSYSSSCYKDGYTTDAEYISEDEARCNLKGKCEEGFNKKFSSGLTVIDYATNDSTKLPKSQKCLNSLNVRNVFTNSLLIDDEDLIDLQEDRETPLMTCLEFLKSEISDENNTDAEDLSVGSLGDDDQSFGLRNRNPSEKRCRLPGDTAVFSFESAQENRIPYLGDSRRSSTAELLTEEETICLDNSLNRGKKRLKKHAVKIEEVSDDSLTDEELLVNDKEWTETDDSGGVRQITQIKTETSIKLEGEGHDLDLGSDDIISRTTTTTTRIITTVTTDGEQETQNEQQVVEDGDDFRHSVEVILNQFMSSDSDATKPEDSTTEHDE